jgi:hypothetical protein
MMNNAQIATENCAKMVLLDDEYPLSMQKITNVKQKIDKMVLNTYFSFPIKEKNPLAFVLAASERRSISSFSIV